MPKTDHHNNNAAELLYDLKLAEIESRIDQITRILYSTDASIYQIMPIGVSWPRNKDEVAGIVEIARKHRIPVLPRGSGTSLAGQAIGNALILDFSRYMDQILDFNQEENSVCVQPGAVLGPLNNRLSKHNLKFGPDPASEDRATMGGILGNNATGAHSILYGMAHNHLLSAETVLSDGSMMSFQEMGDKKLITKQKNHSREGSILTALPEILKTYESKINQNYPKTFRNVAGYNLKPLSEQKVFNPAVLLAGSEGTLGLITSAKLNLVPRPSHTSLYLVHFSDLQKALEVVPSILETNPSAVELIDQMLIQLTRANPAYQSLLKVIEGNPAAVLAVEYQSNDIGQVSNKKSDLTEYGITVPLLSKEDQNKIWKARKAGLGILLSKRGDAKPTSFIEDAAIPVEHLASYAIGIKEYAEEIGVGQIAYYGHASTGCLHIRPQINLKNENGLKQIRLLAEKSLQLALEYGGTTSGEHGEGISRGEFMERLYGPELADAFRKVKQVFDPDNLFNPGKIIDPPAMDNNDLLRYGVNYQARFQPKKTLLSFSNDQGYDRAVEICNGAGVCRQLEGGVMCPSFQATRDETHSTRGRANVLRAAITGKLGHDGMTSSELYQVLDLCLSCQACSSECPSSVDMSKLKAEFLFQYYQKHELPFRSWFFANIAEISRLIQPLSFLVNPLLLSPAGKLTSLLGIHPDRKMPVFARETFTNWHNKQNQESTQNGQVLFFYDTYLEYNYPHIGQAVINILEKTGIDPIVLQEKVDSGRPAYSKGVLQKAKNLAEKNISILSEYAAQGIPILGCEPSVMVMLKKEYRDLVPGNATDQIAKTTFLIEEYIIREVEEGRIKFQFDGQPRKVLYHGHCQQKANFGTASTIKLLNLIDNCQVEEIEAGCCGMAGAFGYEKEHYSLSMEIAELGLAPKIREADPDTIICASGTSCREQILHTTSKESVHPLEIFANALV